MKAYGGIGCIDPHFLDLGTSWKQWSASRPCRFTSGERAPGTHWIGGWMGPRAGLDDVEKRKLLILPGIELRPLGRPARSQSLYRLSYPGSWVTAQTIDNVCPLVSQDNVRSFIAERKILGKFAEERRSRRGSYSTLFILKIWTNYKSNGFV
jgi:hypothetical protein